MPLSESDVLQLISHIIIRYRTNPEFRDTIDQILNSWAQGEPVDLPLEKWSEFVIGYEKLELELARVINEIKDKRLDRFGGILEISAPEKTPYGTGKSQFAKFLKFKLEQELGGRVAYIITATEDIVYMGRKIDDIMAECKSIFRKPIFIVDELDALVRGDPKDIRKRLFDVFTLLIEKYHAMRRERLAPLIILVTSPRVRDYISQSADLHTRIVDRIVHTEYVGRLFKSVDDIAKAIVYGAIIGLCDIIHNIDNNVLREHLLDISRLIYAFSVDGAYALLEQFNEDPEAIPIRTVLRIGLYFSLRIISELLKKLELMSVINRLLSARGVEYGRLIEDTLIRFLTQTWSTRDLYVRDPRGKEILLKINMIPQRVTVGGHQCDFQFEIKLGYTPIGKILVEVTGESDLSPQKRNQLQSFASATNTLLIYAYPDRESKLRFLEALKNFLETTSLSYLLGVVLVPGYIVKYMHLALKLYPNDPERGLYVWLEEFLKFFRKNLEAELTKLAESIYHGYIMSKPIPITRTYVHAEAVEVETKVTIEDQVAAVAKDIIHVWTQNGRRSKSTVKTTLKLFKEKLEKFFISSEVINKLGKERTSELITRITRDIIVKLKSIGIIRWRAEYQTVEKLLMTPRAYITNLSELYKNSNKGVEIIKQVILTYLKPVIES